VDADLVALPLAAVPPFFDAPAPPVDVADSVGGLAARLVVLVVLVVRRAGAASSADLVPDRFVAALPGELVALRFAGSSFTELALVAAT